MQLHYDFASFYIIKVYKRIFLEERILRNHARFFF
jgi:hypothetical protein